MDSVPYIDVLTPHPVSDPYNLSSFYPSITVIPHSEWPSDVIYEGFYPPNLVGEDGIQDLESLKVFSRVPEAYETFLTDSIASIHDREQELFEEKLMYSESIVTDELNICRQSSFSMETGSVNLIKFYREEVDNRKEGNMIASQAPKISSIIPIPFLDLATELDPSHGPIPELRSNVASKKRNQTDKDLNFSISEVNQNLNKKRKVVSLRSEQFFTNSRKRSQPTKFFQTTECEKSPTAGFNFKITCKISNENQPPQFFLTLTRLQNKINEEKINHVEIVKALKTDCRKRKQITEEEQSEKRVRKSKLQRLC
ncbi:hypothetical protein HMI54_001435 [Coelomomyces lativittatus]|nr:hypothetical protein HMI55_000168 [Coelomomyces lativittatus]KAJ1515013.1 hypothetical protein HMI56_006884 [Coelomomyces lativittatus]KAJ1518308.1 hypothetical protein HMI54_001435 [Coelomomyces lativittatus]